MKAGLALEAARQGVPFYAGVHDTDYFAKAPGTKSVGARQRFKAFPHNDGSTRSLWSAAAEFSVLFGSETVITKEDLVKAGLRFDRLNEARKGFLDEATEAWGWRGIVCTDDVAPITLEVEGQQVAREICNTLNWVMGDSASMVGAGEHRTQAQEVGNHIHQMFCDFAEPGGANLAQVYRQMLEPIYSFVASQPVSLETTQTSELLLFNRETCLKPRFEILSRFVSAGTRAASCEAYNQAIKGYPGLYGLQRFGTGAIPFDVVVPGHGRGTLRLGTKGAVIMTHKPLFLTFKKPLTCIEQLADALESKFGAGCSIIGKAVTLIGMLAKEFVFVFHEGASGYVKVSRKLNETLGITANPLLRIKYKTWDSLANQCTWFELPKPLQGAFGVQDICAASFASRWKTVGQEQEARLQMLSKLRKPTELLQFLHESFGSGWSEQLREYRSLHDELGVIGARIKSFRERRHGIIMRWDQIRLDWQQTQSEMGDHFRAAIFEKEPSPVDLAKREEFKAQIESYRDERIRLRAEYFEMGKSERALTQGEDFVRAHNRRREIELEAELKRLVLIREAIISSRGLQNANKRPSAWWIPMVSPGGGWFNEIVKSAECYWEPVS